MARQVEAAFEECREQIDQADLLKTTDWYFEFEFIGKEDTSTNREANDLQEEIEDKDKDKKTTKSPDWIRSSMILCKQMVLNFLSNIAK